MTKAEEAAYAAGEKTSAAHFKLKGLSREYTAMAIVQDALAAYRQHEVMPTQAAMDMVVADNRRMREAGLKLSEAALRVIREYDGTHRLGLAVAEWAKAVANEGGREERPAIAEKPEAFFDQEAMQRADAKYRPSVGLDRQALAEALEGGIADVLMDGGALSPRQFAQRLAQGPMAPFLAATIGERPGQDAVTALKALATATDAFRQCVFDDKRDITVSTGSLRDGDWSRLKRAHDAARTALASLRPSQQTPPAPGGDAVEALKPFAAECERLFAHETADTIGDKCQIWQCGSVEFARSRITYGDLRRARAALAAVAQGQGAGQAWQPIETAPKDGTKFDAWAVNPYTGSGGGRFADVHMRGDDSGFGIVLFWPEAQWEYLERSGPIYPAWRLTHWRPSPTAPATAASEGEQESAAADAAFDNIGFGSRRGGCA